MWDARGSHVLVFKRLNREFLRGAMPLQRMLRTGEDARPLAHLRLVCEHWGYFRALRTPRARARAVAGRSRRASRPRRPASASARVARPFRGLAKTPGHPIASLALRRQRLH